MPNILVAEGTPSAWQAVELVTGVIILRQRPPALFANQAVDVDLFSDGQLRLGAAVLNRSGTLTVS